MTSGPFRFEVERFSDGLEIRTEDFIVRSDRNELKATMSGRLAPRFSVAWDRIQGFSWGIDKTSVFEPRLIYIGVTHSPGRLLLCRTISDEKVRTVVDLLQKELDRRTTLIDLENSTPCDQCHAPILPGENMCAICETRRSYQIGLGAMFVLLLLASAMLPLLLLGFESRAHAAMFPLAVLYVWLLCIFYDAASMRAARKSVKPRRIPKNKAEVVNGT